MIKRVRRSKSNWSIGVTTKGNFLKIETGKTVRYIPLWNIFHNLVSITDFEGVELISHLRRRYRVTVDRGILGFSQLLNQAF